MRAGTLIGGFTVTCAVCAFVGLSASSQAQVTALPAAYGGGALPLAAPSTSKGFAKATAIALVPAGASMRVRVSTNIACSGGRRSLRGDDLLLRVPLAPDGSFGGVQRVKSEELGSARVKLSGVATADRATGTVEVQSYKRPQRCRSGERAFVAKPVDALARLPSGGAPAPGALLVGLSSAKSSIPFGVVARVGNDGSTINHLFTTTILRCKLDGRFARVSRFSADQQFSFTRIRLRTGRFSDTSPYRATRSERRRGIQFSGAQRFAVRATAGGLRATYSSTSRYREPGFLNRCRTARVVMRAVAAD